MRGTEPTTYLLTYKEPSRARDAVRGTSRICSSRQVLLWLFRRHGRRSREPVPVLVPECGMFDVDAPRPVRVQSTSGNQYELQTHAARTRIYHDDTGASDLGGESGHMHIDGPCLISGLGRSRGHKY